MKGMSFSPDSAEWYTLSHIFRKIEQEFQVKAGMESQELNAGKLWISGLKKNIFAAKRVLSKKFTDLVFLEFCFTFTRKVMILCIV